MLSTTCLKTNATCIVVSSYRNSHTQKHQHKKKRNKHHLNKRKRKGTTNFFLISPLCVVYSFPITFSFSISCFYVNIFFFSLCLLCFSLSLFVFMFSLNPAKTTRQLTHKPHKFCHSTRRVHNAQCTQPTTKQQQAKTSQNKSTHNTFLFFLNNH